MTCTGVMKKKSSQAVKNKQQQNLYKIKINNQAVDKWGMCTVISCTVICVSCSVPM